MAKYLAMRIRAGAMDYAAVVARYPRYRVEIDGMLGQGICPEEKG